MAVPDRFRPDDEGQVESTVRVTPGTDSLTNLPILIYEFDGVPPAAKPEFEYLPRFVDTGIEGERGWAVVNPMANRVRRWTAAEGALTQAQLLGTARSLREAAESGLVHGDIRPERILLLDSRQGSSGDEPEATIEGFGIPWKPAGNRFIAPEADGSATPAADVWALATTLQATGIEPDDATIQAVLEQCRATDPELRPTAEELAEALEQLLESPIAGAANGSELEAASKPASRPNELRVPPSEELREPRPDEPRKQPPNEQRERPEEHRDRRPEARPQARSEERVVRPVVTGRVAAAANQPNHDAAPPADPAGGNRNRLVLLASLMAAVVILALLSFFWPGTSSAPGNVTREATIYVVEVTVSPEDLPPVTIHLVSAPTGSSLEGGDRLGTAPRHLALDRAGTWSFRGSLGERTSETMEIQVPEERSLQLTIPPEPSGE